MSRRTGFPQEVRELILARSSGMCEVMLPCCTFHAVDLQHRRARGIGGSRLADTNSAGNGLAVCRECHSFIEGHPSLALLRGWRVRQGVAPSSVPVVWRGRERFLDDVGGFEGVRDAG